MVGGGELVCVPDEVLDVEVEVDDAVFAGLLGGSFGCRAAGAGLFGTVLGAAGGGVGNERRLAETKAEHDVLHHHEGDERGGEAGACEFAKHFGRDDRGLRGEVNSGDI